MYEENSFENKLRELRARKHWTQDDAAKHLGVSLHTYSNWETGKRIPSPKRRTQIAELFRLKQEEADALYRAAGQVPQIIDNLPFRPNPFFTGREAELEQIRTQLQDTGTAAITQPVSISGLGGIGKTELALEYAHRSYRDVYRTVLWVNAADEGKLQASYDSIAQLLKLPDCNIQGPEQRIQAVKDWLREHMSWLLIMDNADDLSLANSFLPSQPLGHVLFTTRSQLVSDSDIAAQITVEEMTPERGLDFLLRRSGRMQDEDNLDAARQVVELLGGLPLALDQAGAYIAGTDLSFADYLKRYSEQRQCLLSKRRLTENTSLKQTRHPEPVTVTFELIFQELHEQYPLAGEILNFCAFFHPDGIPEELFQYDNIFKPNTVEFDEAFTILRRYSLLKRNMHEQTFSIHRLVQAVIIDTLSPELRAQGRERVLRTLNAAFPSVELRGLVVVLTDEEIQQRKQCDRLYEHVLAYATWSEHELIPTPEEAALFHKAGDFLLDRGPYTIPQAEILYQRALSIREQCLGAEHPDTKLSFRWLQTTYSLQNKYEQLLLLEHRALADKEQQLGAEHPDVAISLNNAAVLSIKLRKYEQAEVLLLRALTIQEQQLGIKHFDTEWCLSNLTRLYRHYGSFEQKVAFFRRVLAIQEQQLGITHPDTQATRKIFAAGLRKVGRDAEADAIETGQS